MSRIVVAFFDTPLILLLKLWNAIEPYQIRTLDLISDSPIWRLHDNMYLPKLLYDSTDKKRWLIYLIKNVW